MTDTDYSNEVSDIVEALETKFQEKLESGTNIKTINNSSLLGSGNISISGSGTVDDELDTTSTNPVQNKVIAAALNSKADANFTPQLVYTCSNFNSTYINTSATNRLQLYKLGSIYFLRYFISTNTLPNASKDYLINNDSISSEYRPSINITFHISTSSNHNAKLTINTIGQVRISADADSVAISFAGSQTYWWAEAVSPVVALSLSSSSVSYGSSVTLSATVTQSGSAVAGETVTFYDGSTSLGTATTNSSGVATLSKSDLSVGSHSLTAVYGSVTSSSESLTVSKATPTISLSTSSATPTYGSSITLSGTLSSLGSGASVKIYDGNTLLDTVTTSTGGAFSYSTSSLTVGSHSLTAVFEGNTNYNSVTSSAVSVTVGKITSTISLSTSASSVTYGTSVTLSGTLSVGSGKSVKLYDGATLVDTLTTGTNGAFSYTSSSIAVGSHSYTASYDGDSTHTNVTSSSVSVTVQAAPSYDSIELTSDKSIISAYDGESATLTAQLQDDGVDVPISGVSLSFVIKKGSTVIDTKTATTGADGSCNVSYVGNHTGDLNIQVSDGIIFSETYSIEDCLKYGFKSTDTFHSIASSSSMTVSDGVATGYNKLTDCSIAMSYDFEITLDYQCSRLEGGVILADLTNTNNFDKNCYQILTQDQSNGINFNGYTGTTRSFHKTLSSSQGVNQYNTLKFVKQNGTVSAYFNGTLIGSNNVLSNSISNLCIGMYRWNNNVTQSMKNLKIKPL